jgi:hypothetical protein
LLYLLFQPGPVQAQEPGKPAGIRAKVPDTEQFRSGNTVQLHTYFPDSLPRIPAFDPEAFRDPSAAEQTIRGLLPDSIRTFLQHPNSNDIPKGQFLPADLNTKQFIPAAKNAGPEIVNIIPGIGVPEGFRDSPGIIDPVKAMRQKIPVIPGSDGLSKTGTDIIKDQNPDPGFFSDESYRLLPGKVISEPEFRLLDSIRKAAPDIRGLKQKEEQLGKGFKKIAFAKRPSFRDRTYLEGVIGLDPTATRIRNLSPAIGYYLNPKMSLGLGPNINFGNPKNMLRSAVGARSFFKYELISKKAYLQAEDLVHANRESGTGQEKPGFGGLKHSPFLGAGYLLSLSKAVSLNILMMYRVGQSPQPEGQTGPFNIRLGMSTSGLPE